ncbi:MAG: tubulin-like doman-containing protein [Acidimicrobiales bacterium]
MRLFQPILVVLLGGSGSQVGAAIERALRATLCGPDGTRLFRFPHFRDGGYRPFQLPGCVQFVYIDLAADDIRRSRRSVAPPGLWDVANLNAVIADLRPSHASYAQVALRLRHAGTYEYVAGWLPPAGSGLDVAPLADGAGGYPTVGRAALFDCLATAEGLAPLERPIVTALGRLAGANGEIMAFTGEQPTSLAVFVIFSGNGGTGGGMNYDALHVVGDLATTHLAGLPVHLYPIMLMSSVFDPAKGGGRAERLNAAHALLDLSRLVDRQNTGALEDLADGVVRYPGGASANLRPATIQTAMLIHRADGHERMNTQESIAPLLQALTRSRADEADHQPGAPSPTFVTTFVNHASRRASLSGVGVGRRGLSAVSAFSLHVPHDEVAAITTDHLVAEAVSQLDQASPMEDNEQALAELIAVLGLDPLRVCAPHAVAPVDDAVRGADEVCAALVTLAETMERALESLRRELHADVMPGLAAFRANQGLAALAGVYGLFRLSRVILGDRQLTGLVEQEGFVGWCHRRARVPDPPEGLTERAPSPRRCADGRGCGTRPFGSTSSCSMTGTPGAPSASGGERGLSGIPRGSVRSSASRPARLPPSMPSVTSPPPTPTTSPGGGASCSGRARGSWPSCPTAAATTASRRCTTPSAGGSGDGWACPTRLTRRTFSTGCWVMGAG